MTTLAAPPMVPASTPADAAPAAPRAGDLHRFTAADFMRMVEQGHFDEKRVELLEGLVCDMAPQNDPHQTAISKLIILLARHYGDTQRFWFVCQGSLRLPPASVPSPDFHVFEAPLGTPSDRCPPPMLVIEVSDTTYLADSRTKLRLYARHGIADYWILNLPARRLELYRDPVKLAGPDETWGYQTCLTLGPGESASPLRGPGVALAVDDMLP